MNDLKNLRRVPLLAKQAIEPELRFLDMRDGRSVKEARALLVGQLQTKFARGLKDLMRRFPERSDWTTVGRFYIGKQDGQRYWSEKQALANNKKVRPIVFMQNATLRKELGELVRHSGLDKTLNSRQYGFKSSTTQEGYRTALSTHPWCLELDLSNAFNSVSANTLYWTLRQALDLSKDKAQLLTDSMTVDGYAYQGHPVFPVIFAIIFQAVCEEVRKIHGLSYVAYADDVSFYSKGYISPNKAHQVKKLIKSYGFLVNEEKTIVTDRPSALGAHVRTPKLKRHRSKAKRAKKTLHDYRVAKHHVTGHLYSGGQQHRQEMSEFIAKLPADTYCPLDEVGLPGYLAKFRNTRRGRILSGVALQNGQELYCPMEITLSLHHWLNQASLDQEYYNGESMALYNGKRRSVSNLKRRNYVLSHA